MIALASFLAGIAVGFLWVALGPIYLGSFFGSVGSLPPAALGVMGVFLAAVAFFIAAVSLLGTKKTEDVTGK